MSSYSLTATNISQQSPVLKKGIVNLLVCHIGMDTPELQAMTDLNPFGPKYMSKHRQGELNALISPKTAEFIKQNNISMITYHQLINKVGLENMKRPAE